MLKSRFFNSLVTGFVVIGSFLLSGCGGKQVNCLGVSKEGPNVGVTMDNGACKKIADSKIVNLTPVEQATVKPYPYDTYVKCYGVAAAAMNDCGTKTSACGGSVTIAKSPDAWIALPKGVCDQLKGGIAVMPTKS